MDATQQVCEPTAFSRFGLLCVISLLAQRVKGDTSPPNGMLPVNRPKISVG